MQKGEGKGRRHREAQTEGRGEGEREREGGSRQRERLWLEEDKKYSHTEEEAEREAERKGRRGERGQSPIEIKMLEYELLLGVVGILATASLHSLIINGPQPGRTCHASAASPERTPQEDDLTPRNGAI